MFAETNATPVCEAGTANQHRAGSQCTPSKSHTVAVSAEPGLTTLTAKDPRRVRASSVTRANRTGLATADRCVASASTHENRKEGTHVAAPRWRSSGTITTRLTFGVLSRSMMR